jgi:hypothetical protein
VAGSEKTSKLHILEEKWEQKWAPSLLTSNIFRLAVGTASHLQRTIMLQSMFYQQTVSDIQLLKFRHDLGMIDGRAYADGVARIIDHYNMDARNATEISP